ncbi:hypothetical protein C8R46DRAFT_923824 [Mycena filopes]|nr:hypothetical protein C8R46DRAFT_923824 [Mycena filopes]
MYTPSHPDSFVVKFQSGDFSSFLKTRRAIVCSRRNIDGLRDLTTGPKAYSTVQCGRGPEDNVELNSDFLYGKYLASASINHSCEPNIAFDLSSADPTEWHVRALKDIDAGSPVTFFYPSTEWEMDQAFECQCGTKYGHGRRERCCSDSVQTCLGRIQGAKFLTVDQVKERGWTSPWIVELMEERDV